MNIRQTQVKTSHFMNCARSAPFTASFTHLTRPYTKPRRKKRPENVINVRKYIQQRPQHILLPHKLAPFFYCRKAESSAGPYSSLGPLS